MLALQYVVLLSDYVSVQYQDIFSLNQQLVIHILCSNSLCYWSYLHLLISWSQNLRSFYLSLWPIQEFLLSLLFACGVEVVFNFLIVFLLSVRFSSNWRDFVVNFSIVIFGLSSFMTLGRYFWSLVEVFYSDKNQPFYGCNSLSFRSIDTLTTFVVGLYILLWELYYFFQ